MKRNTFITFCLGVYFVLCSQLAYADLAPASLSSLDQNGTWNFGTSYNGLHTNSPGATEGNDSWIYFSYYLLSPLTLFNSFTDEGYTYYMYNATDRGMLQFRLGADSYSAETSGNIEVTFVYEGETYRPALSTFAAHETSLSIIDHPDYAVHIDLYGDLAAAMGDDPLHGFINSVNGNITSTVPIPPTVLIFGPALFGLWGMRRRMIKE